MKWISVDDQLPNDMESVICWGKLGRQDERPMPNEGFYSHDGLWNSVRSLPLNAELHDVTHWMPMPDGPGERNHDVDADDARSLHRVVRAMHDGNCPKCGSLGSTDEFLRPVAELYVCPTCEFTVTFEEADRVMEQFFPFQQKAVAVFEAWKGVSDV